MSEPEISEDEMENYSVISESEDEFINSTQNSESITNSDVETDSEKNLSKSMTDKENQFSINQIDKNNSTSFTNFDTDSEDDSDNSVVGHLKKIQCNKNIIISDSEESISPPSVRKSRISDKFGFGKNNGLFNSESIPKSDLKTDPERNLSKSTTDNENHFSINHIDKNNSTSLINIDNDSVYDNDTSVVGHFNKSNKNLAISDSEESISSPSVHKSRISDKFRFGKNNSLFSGTVDDPQTSTPKNPVTGKRLLNKTVDTPKTFKQIKEIDTPRKVNQISSSSSDESDKENEDIIDISSGEECSNYKSLPKKPNQPTLLQSVKKEIPKEEDQIEDKKDNFMQVSHKEYQEQSEKVRQIQTDLQRASETFKKVNLDYLPDKGVSFKIRIDALEQNYLKAVLKLSTMKITKESIPTTSSNLQKKMLSWNEIQEGTGSVLPRTFGKQAVATINTERQLTVDRLQQLHGSLQTCPKETDFAEPPKGLKVELMIHQKRALSWLMWRENQKPSGGILADDMGLGKTLTMISLMLKCNVDERNGWESDDDEENSPEKKSTTCNGGTLVVCPASLLNQWSGELERRTKRGLASYEVYHGPKRETKPKKLANHDMVITTYSVVKNECEKNGAIFRVKWRRIIIDEAHQIRNHKSQTSDAVCRLPGKSRWALTGTPVHNKELDMYALMKFLKCTPFDDLKVWKRWVGDKSTGGTDRLHTVISSLMLRRTKVELIEQGLLNAMPKRTWELIPVDLTEKERGVYSKILLFSRTLFAQFLHQRAEKHQDGLTLDYNLNAPNQEYFSMREKLLKMNKLKDIKHHEILVLLLRLRQICNHPSLITNMLEDGNMELLGNDEEETDKASAMNLLDQLNKLTLTDETHSENANVAEGISEEALSLKEVAKTVLNPSDPIFSKTKMSSKIKVLIKLLKEKVIESGDKAVIVSQWSSFLHLISYQLKEEGLIFDQLDGQVPVPKRMDMVDRFNDPKNKMKILLLSLTAGGVGLNLVGANHLILLDLHWNPQLENQAQDRIYRVGQEKPVFVYKFMATDTIEKRILDLQEKKLEMANNMLTGSSQANKNKLTLKDLKMLFDM